MSPAALRRWWLGPGWSALPARLVAAVMLPVAGCSGDGGTEGPLYVDATAASGIDFRLVNGASGERYILETMVGGVAFLDYDGDGDADLFAANGHSDPVHADKPGKETDRLYRNDGKGRFSDVTTEAGVGDARYSFGVAVGDYDNDGDPDILVTNFGRNTLFRNEGAREGAVRFTDVTEAAGMTREGFHTSAVWFDMDRDGDLDLYVCRYLRYRPASSRRCSEGGQRVYCSPKFFPGEPDLLYRNRGDGTFEEIGEKAGIARAGDNEGKGLGVVAFDFDRDGLQDIYVANDTTPNFLWRSNGDGTFTDVAYDRGVAVSAEGEAQAGMGVDLADVTGDGMIDIHVTNFSHELNALYLGRPDGLFVESARQANLGMSYVPLGFGTLFADVDLDGDEDIVNANGHVNDLVETTDPGTGSTYRQRPALLLNDGSGRFEEAGSRAGPPFSVPVVGRGLARADIDGDGDIDLAMSAIDRSIIVLENRSAPAKRSVTVKLVGTRSPRDGHGARVEAEVGGKRRTFICQSARSYLSASDPRIVIALAGTAKVDRLTVHWPGGTVQEIRDLAPPGPIVVEEPGSPGR